METVSCSITESCRSSPSLCDVTLILRQSHFICLLVQNRGLGRLMKRWLNKQLKYWNIGCWNSAIRNNSLFNTLSSFCFSIAEVIRTRLREEGSKYRSFFQTLLTVPREEGYRALYRGLTTHLVRQIPNTAIMMCTYEVVVYLLGR